MVKYRDYTFANFLITLQTIVAVLLIGLGLFGLFFGPDMSGSGQYAMLGIVISIALKMSAVGSFIGGLIMLALAQMARAHVHTAEMTWEMLELARKADRAVALQSVNPDESQSYVIPPPIVRPLQEGSVISDKIDLVHLKPGSIAERSVRGRNGIEHTLFIFPGGKVRAVAGSTIMEFASSKDAEGFFELA